MKPHEDHYRLNHMLAYAREALEMIKEKDRTDLSRDRMLELALVRLIEVSCRVD